MITCAEAVRQLWEYLDGVVEEADREAIEEHLSFCRRCCGELDFADSLRARVQLLAGLDARVLDDGGTIGAVAGSAASGDVDARRDWAGSRSALRSSRRARAA